MRTAFLAAAIAFPMGSKSPLPGAARRVARVLMALLDRRRERLDGPQ